MMYRSQWAQAEGQEVVLAVRLRRAFFDSLLAQVVPSAFDSTAFTSTERGIMARPLTMSPYNHLRGGRLVLTRLRRDDSPTTLT